MQISYFLLKNAGHMLILNQEHLVRNDMKEQSSQKYTGINILYIYNYLLQNQSRKLPKMYYSRHLSIFIIDHKNNPGKVVSNFFQ